MLLSSLSYLFCHCGGEEHCLTVAGAQPDYFLHLFLKVFIQHPTQEKNSKVRQLHLVVAKKHYLRHSNKDCPVAWEKDSRKLPSRFSLLSCLALPVRFIQNQHLNTAQVEGRAVVKMINQSPRSGDKNIWPSAQSCFLSLHI